MLFDEITPTIPTMPKKQILKKRAQRHTSESEFSLESLHESLKTKSKADLIDMIVSLADDHDSVYKAFERAAEVKAAKKPDTHENLFKKAKSIIDKGTKIDRNDPYFRKIGFGGPKLHLEPLDEVVKLLAKNKMPETFPILQKIAEHLLERGKHYFGETSAETAFDYNGSFETIAEAIIACKEDADRVLVWADQVEKLDVNCITGEFHPMIEKAYRKKSKTGKNS